MAESTPSITPDNAFDIATDLLDRRSIGEDVDEDRLNEALFVYCAYGFYVMGVRAGMSPDEAAEAAERQFSEGRDFVFNIERDPHPDGSATWTVGVEFADVEGGQNGSGEAHDG